MRTRQMQSNNLLLMLLLVFYFSLLSFFIIIICKCTVLAKSACLEHFTDANEFLNRRRITEDKKNGAKKKSCACFFANNYTMLFMQNS